VDYPQEKLHILIASDGSTDGTNEVLAGVSGISWFSYSPRRGKAYALNQALERVMTDIVVFCDVRQEIETLALKHLITRLNQPDVGAVSGELVHRLPKTQVAANIGLYWRYEKWIRTAESRVNSVVGATGALYAIRKELYVPLREDTLLDDFEIPMEIVRRGKRNVLENRALFFDEIQSDSRGERMRKIRTLTGNFQSFARNSWLFNPAQNPVFLQFISHKVFRLFVPYALLMTFVSSFVALGTFYRLAFWAQVVFYVVAVAGLLAGGLRRNRIVSFAVVFVELNMAAVRALIRYLFGRIDARWEKT
jgi:cellulose synthase/poly-beta-1,6-N-acetylglucosamine synthase-like glycosyltransferase